MRYPLSFAYSWAAILLAANTVVGQIEIQSAPAYFYGGVEEDRFVHTDKAARTNDGESKDEDSATTILASTEFQSTQSAPSDSGCGICLECGCKAQPENACGQCDCAKQKALQAAVASAYKPLFFDNKFDYLCDPCYCDGWPGDRLKRRSLGDLIIWDLGGQYRARLHNERNHRGLGLTGIDDDFLLHRTRVFANVEAGDRFRAYAEYLDAESNYENFPPRGIEVNRSDLLNLFGDLKFYDDCCGEAWVRVGRQELLYGNQRLASPLDWGNTRRNFEGYKAFYKGQNWNVDAFYTRPIFAHPVRFDGPDYDQEFSGFYSVYKGRQTQTYDFYYFAYNNGDANFQFDTAGARWEGSQDHWLWEAEGAFQFGDNPDGTNHSAGFWVAGLGRKINQCAWKPTLWVYYDWASGDDNRGAGNGFHHLFPLAHKYMGFMDLFGRRNLETPNVQLALSPREKLKLLFWYYYLFLENKNDTPYNIVMAPVNAANAPASAELGHELDCTLTYLVNERTGLVFGYSHFFAGDYYKLTPGVPFRGDADFFYTEFTFNF